MCEIYDNTMIFLSAIKIVAFKRNETVEKVHKELITLCVNFLQFQSMYAKKTDKEQFDLRPTRNEMILQIFQELKEINLCSGRDIFQFEMPVMLRPFERGQRVSNAVNNIVWVYKFINSSEVRNKLRECI